MGGPASSVTTALNCGLLHPSLELFQYLHTWNPLFLSVVTQVIIMKKQVWSTALFKMRSHSGCSVFHFHFSRPSYFPVLHLSGYLSFLASVLDRNGVFAQRGWFSPVGGTKEDRPSRLQLHLEAQVYIGSLSRFFNNFKFFQFNASSKFWRDYYRINMSMFLTQAF